MNQTYLHQNRCIPRAYGEKQLVQRYVKYDINLILKCAKHINNLLMDRYMILV